MFYTSVWLIRVKSFKVSLHFDTLVIETDTDNPAASHPVL